MHDPRQHMMKAGILRNRTQELLDSLTSRAREFNLSLPGKEYVLSQQRLQRNDALVLVMGEAKRGKSTFINALLGRDILPTGIGIVTSQVFHVLNSAVEKYRLRFEDGCSQEITAADLPRYGSQFEADMNDLPGPGALLRWIEVETPASFLPEGVALLDTPGVGALYATHKQIVRRFLPRANAVIFVLDSEAPILETELAILDEVLQVTSDVFFIQTKIDLKNRGVWQAILQRNEQILTQRFADRLTDIRIWPIGSSLVRKAITEGDDAYLKASHYRALEAGFQEFLFRVAGWSGIANALAAADAYHSAVGSALSNRLAAVSAQSFQKQAALRKAIQESQDRFDAEYGDHSANRRNFALGLDRIIAQSKADMTAALAPGGTMETKLRERIEATGDLEATRELAEHLGDMIAEAALAKWNWVCRSAERQCVELMLPFQEADAAAHLPEELRYDDLLYHSNNRIPVTQIGAKNVDPATGMWQRLKGARMETLTVSWLAGAIVMAVPAAWPLATAGVIGAMIIGWNNTAKKELEMTKEKAVAHMTSVLQPVRAYFFYPQPAEHLRQEDAAQQRDSSKHDSSKHDSSKQESYSRVDEYFLKLRELALERVHNIVQQKRQEVQADLDCLTEIMRLDEEARLENAEQAQRQVIVWEMLGTSLQNAVAELFALQREFEIEVVE